MREQHTPGPWRLVPDSRRGVGIQARANSVSAAHIAYVQFVGTDLEDGLANAQLIAAAPELLAALKAILQGRPELWGDEVIGGITDFPIDEAALFAADEAIAKAEGRS